MERKEKLDSIPWNMEFHGIAWQCVALIEGMRPAQFTVYWNIRTRQAIPKSCRDLEGYFAMFREPNKALGCGSFGDPVGVTTLR